MRTTAYCRSCSAQIVWGRTEAGRLMPIDAGSAGDPSGQLAVRSGQGRELHVRVLRRGEEMRAGEYRGVSHWQTCRNADQHRAPRPRAAS